jgi:hypothetical protein
VILNRKTLLWNVLALTFILILVGISQFRSFGISYDEPAMRMHGIANAKYVSRVFLPSLSDKLNQNEIYRSVPEIEGEDELSRTHPAMFELLLVGIEFGFGLTDDKKALWEYRHLATFLFNSTGLIVFFLMLLWRFKRYWLAYLGVTLVIVSPRITADLFYNNKDAVFMTTNIFATFSSICYLLRPSKITFLVSGLAIGFSASIRQVGLIPALLIYFMVLVANLKFSLIQKLKIIAAHFLFTLFTLIMFQPYYWEETVPRVLKSFNRANNFSHPGVTLTNGELLQNASLPWNYLLLWIMVTVPVGYLVLFLVGSLSSSWMLMDRRLRLRERYSHDSLIDLFIILSLLFPISIVFISDTNLYNGWRHFYFIYPLLVYFMVWNFSKSFVLNGRIPRIFLCITLIISLIATTTWMVSNKPFYNLYFNDFAGSEIEKRWEVDYWSLSGREIVLWIAKNDLRDSIFIQTSDNSPLYDSAVFLEKRDKERMNFLWFSEGISNADYVVFRSSYSAGSIEVEKELLSAGSGFTILKERHVGNAEVYKIYGRIKFSEVSG